jgi:cell division protein FtsB
MLMMTMDIMISQTSLTTLFIFIYFMVAKFRKNKRDEGANLFLAVFIGALILLVLGFLIVSNYRINQKRAELNEQKEYLQEQLRILEERSEQLQTQALDSIGEDYLETEARERFNLKKPGEQVVTVLPSEDEGLEERERQWWNPFTW